MCGLGDVVYKPLAAHSSASVMPARSFSISTLSLVVWPDRQSRPRGPADLIGRVAAAAGLHLRIADAHPAQHIDFNVARRPALHQRQRAPVRGQAVVGGAAAPGSIISKIVG